MNKTLKSILETLIYIIIVAVLVIGIPKILSYTLNTPYPMAIITSESMWPSLKKNDMVFITHVDKNDLKVGDIIVYKNDRGFTIHRIQDLKSETIITKGDANNITDIPVTYEEVIGKTVNYGNYPIRIPYIGNITIWASNITS